MCSSRDLEWPEAFEVRFGTEGRLRTADLNVVTGPVMVERLAYIVRAVASAGRTVVGEMTSKSLPGGLDRFPNKLDKIL